jgi:tetratricopeptide (TPR) repeat protein
VDPSGNWQTLQLHLKSARAAREAGDIALALQEVDAALAIDPDYLAAKVLRESLANQRPVPQPTQQPAVSAPPPQPEPQAHNKTAKPASLEERARRRRIDHRIGAARTAILLSRFPEARAALAELAELDPALPAIPEIAAELETARVRFKRKRLMLLVGVAAAATGAIAGTLAGRSTQAHRGSVSANSMPHALLVAHAMPSVSASLPDAEPMLSAEFFEPAAAAIPEEAPTSVVRSAPARVPPPTTSPSAFRARVETPTPVAERVSAAAAERPALTPAVEHASAPPALVERATGASPAMPRTDTPAAVQPAFLTDDPALIRDALQRYRRAYNALDARLAHAVYPGVDESALTHAFEGLRSQSLEFEACSVDAFAESARAVCRGSARFVPKVGSREPRAESRVWTFRLRKDDGDWTIESAWTNR